MHGMKLTPRLPRGVSRIPHLVQANEVCYANQQHYQHEESAEEIQSRSAKASNRYLTFSRDQAASHFKLLREELSGQKSNEDERPPAAEPEEPVQVNAQASQQNSSHHHPRARAADSEGNQSGISSPVSAPSLRPQHQHQQPICEAFIMTGQSMLKLSSNESEKNNNNITKTKTLTTTNHREQQSHDSRAKSLSLNKLNNLQKHNNHLSSAEEIGQARDLDQASSEQELRVSTPADERIECLKAPKPITERFAGVVLLQNGHNHAANQNIEPTEAKQTVDVSMRKGSPSQGRNEDSPSDSPPNSPVLQARVADCSPTISQPTRNDQDSAKRLAKRLYNLSGFKRSDVCHHLSKSNPFSQLVAQEYLSLFDFRSMKLDSALRKFLSKLRLNGETQEREKLLSQFSQRYFDCNRAKFPNADTVQTLVCALILLNTDLHGAHSKKKRSKITLGAFIDGLNSSIDAYLRADRFGDTFDHADRTAGALGEIALAGSQTGLSQATSGYTLPRNLLFDLYESIKKRPLKCADDKCDMSSFETELDKIYNQQVGSRSNTLPTRRFAPGSNAPSSTLSPSSRRQLKQGLGRLSRAQEAADTSIEFRSGYLNRKRVLEAGGVPTARGRRSWRRVHACLHDLRLILRPGIHDESKQQQRDKQLTAKQQAKIRAQNLAQDMKNTIKIHHSFAKRSTSYTKRECVFHLTLADQSELLVQANNEQDMSLWIDTINFAAACLSSPALPSAITNTKRQQVRAQRPILPVSYTKLSYWEQLIDHEERLQRLKVGLDEHLAKAPDTKRATKRHQAEFIEKIALLKQDIERYTVYVDLMRKKSNSPEAIILSKHPQIASLTPSEEMVLSLPSFAPPNLDETADAEPQANK